MSNVIKIKRGSVVPSSSDLEHYELGYRTGTNELYINDGGNYRQLGGSTFAASAITSGTFADARIAASNVTQHTDSKYLRSDANDTASGVITFSNRVTSTGTGGFTIGNYAGYDRIQNSSNNFSFLTDGNAYANTFASTVYGASKLQTAGFVEIVKTGSTGCLLRINNSGWPNATTHDIIYNSYLSNLGDYTYLKSAGNSGSGHGIAVVADEVFAVGDTNIETGVLTNSATAPFTDTWFTVNGGGNGVFKGTITSGGQIAINDTNAILYRNNNDLEIKTYGGYDINLIPAGGVGIGTASPSSKLEVSHVQNAESLLTLHNNRQDASNVPIFGIAGKQSGTIVGKMSFYRGGGGNSGYITFSTKVDNSTALSEKMRLDGAGRLGIGVTDPWSATVLDLGATSNNMRTGNKIYFYDSNKYIGRNGSDIQYYNSHGNHRFYRNTTEIARIDSIRLNLYGTDSNEGGELAFHPGTSGSYSTVFYLDSYQNKLRVHSGGVERFSVNTSGVLDIPGSLTLGTALAIAEGGTGATSAHNARIGLGLGTLAELSQVDAATIADNSVGADELNVSGDGTNGQVLKSDGDGTFSWFSLVSSSNASTLDNLDSTQFLRSDTADTSTGKITFSAGMQDNISNVGSVGGTGLEGNQLSTTDWANLPVGFGGMMRSGNQSYGNPGSNYFLFHKIANRDSGGGWGGIAVGYNSNAELYVGTTTVSGSYATWSKVWNEANDGAGSGLDADLLDGLQLETSGRNDNANKVVRTDSNGYLTVGWINTPSGNTTTASSDYYVNTNDGYIRKKTLANVRTEIMGVSSGASFLRSDATSGTITSQDWNTYVNGTEVHFSSVTNHSGSNRPSGAYHYGVALSYSVASGGKFQLYAPETGSLGTATNQGLWYRTGWNTTYRQWAQIWDSTNDGSGSGLDADLLDGVQGSSFLRSDTADTISAQLTMGTQKALVANNYGRGVYGLYNSGRYQHVWSMGTAYNLADDGTTSGNLYGLSFTHTNAGGQSKPGLSHQLLVMDNGVTKSAIGNGIWTNGHITMALSKRLYLDGGTNDWISTNGNNIISTYVNGNERLRVADSYTYMPNKIYGGDGTEAAPMYNFWNDSDTGMYRIGADDLGFTAGGSLKYGILNGLNRFYANVVVGPNNNNSKPYIQYKDGYDTASTPSYSWYYDNGCGIGHPAGSVIAFSTGSNERGRFNNNGLYVTGLINATAGITTNYGVSLTNGATDFLMYNNSTENVLYMRDITNNSMLQTWGVNTVTMNKNTSIQGNLDVSGNSFLQYGLVVNEGSHDADFRVESNSNAHMIQADAGNSRVGINNSSPYESLDAKSLSSTSPAIVANGAAANGTFNMAHGYAGANGDYVCTYSTQYSTVGLVLGYAVKASTNVADQFLNSADNSNFTRGAFVLTDSLKFWTAGAQTGTLNNAVTMTERFRVTPAGVGHFDNDVVAFSSTVSDKRLKENITTIDNALDKVMALRGVEYDWTATSRKDTHDIGLIAQEVEEVIPELVTEHELCTGEFSSGNEKTFKTVNYDKMVGVLIEAIKEQQVQINELKTKIGEQNG